MDSPAQLPCDCQIRPAQVTDIWSIRLIVLRAKLDPTQLRWRQFWVIEQGDRIIGCGQLRSFGECQELGSLVVRSPWRRQGMGSALARHLIQQANRPLYLECLGKRLAGFYQQFGFVPVAVQDLPPPLRRKFGLSHAIARLLNLPLYQLHFPPSPLD